jgi:organic radical activating enzyme
MREGIAKVGGRLLERTPGPVRNNYALRRAGRRIFAPPGRTEVPERPIGAKLELTYHCNLRCSFCYTDSPRRTLARTAEMEDEQWLDIVDQALDLGVIEAVLTGGEPLLRRDLALEAARRFSAAGVMVTMNTNGWFMDADTADGLAEAGVRVHVSLDGASAELHDASRGVPGSWRRAVEAVAMLLDRGVRVQVVHVVTPRNLSTLDEFLDQMRVLTPSSVRVTAVGLVGAAARGGEWEVAPGALRGAAARFGAPARPRIQLVDHAPLATDGFASAPLAFLVRPNGAFLADSLHPFSFGHAARQPLDECWAAMRASWRDDAVRSWPGGATTSRQATERKVMPYRDDELVIAGLDPGRAATRKDGPALERAIEVLEAKRPDFPADGRGDVEAAAARVRELALARRHRLAPVRWSGSRSGQRLVRVLAHGRVSGLNATAGLVMDSLDGGTTGDAVAALARAHPRLDAARVERDAIEARAALVEQGIAVAALAPHVSAQAHERDLAGAGDLLD